MDAPTIECMYSCPLCGIVDRKLQIKARQGEDIKAWMDQVIITFGRDHGAQSPFCHPDRLKDIKIPYSPDAPVGAAPTRDSRMK